MRKAMLTTIDNPYDPFENFSQWFIYDSLRGYNSTAYLARIARTSEALSDEENAEIVEQAIDEIIKYDFLNIYVKKVKEIEDDEDTLDDSRVPPGGSL